MTAPGRSVHVGVDTGGTYTDVVADDGTVVAKVRKQIYVRLKKSRRTTEDRSSDAA